MQYALGMAKLILRGQNVIRLLAAAVVQVLVRRIKKLLVFLTVPGVFQEQDLIATVLGRVECREMRTIFYKIISKNMKKKVLVFLIITILSVSFFAIKETKAGAGENVWGWAWSENIGWISFNNTSGGGAVNYGVHIDPDTGLFSGYAWSENIGWISFEPADLVGCPSGTCNVSVGLNTGVVSGWAKALVAADGWDGWIGLSGAWADGVSISSVPAPSEFEGWAWGDDVVGWVSFNCSNTGSCAAVDYKVMTDIIIILNDPPYIEPGSTNIQYKEYCDFSPTGRIAFEWTYQDDEGDQQAQYNLQVATDAGFSNLVVDATVNQSVLPGSNGSTAVSVVQSPTAPIDDLDIAYGDSYFWRASVKAATGNLNWSVWESGPNFSTPSNAYPNPNFTWYPSSPPAEVEVTFTDNSTCYTGSSNCKDDVNTIYGWDFDNDSVIDDATKGDVLYTYLVTGDYTVRLEVTDVIDGIQRTCYQEEDLTATLPLPTWKEIVPF